MLEKRLTQLLLLFGVLNLVVIAHLVRLQIVECDYWVAQGEDNRTRRIFTPQLRGTIYLADGAPVAQSEYRYDLAFTPGAFRDRWAPGALVSLLRKLEMKGGFWYRQSDTIVARARDVSNAEVEYARVGNKVPERKRGESAEERKAREGAEAAKQALEQARQDLEDVFEAEAEARARILREVVGDPEAAWRRLLAAPAFAIPKVAAREHHLDGGFSRQFAVVLGPRTYARIAAAAAAAADPPEKWITVGKALAVDEQSLSPSLRRRLLGLRREATAYAALARALPAGADRELWLEVLQAERNARRRLIAIEQKEAEKAERRPDPDWWHEPLAKLGRASRMLYRKVAGDHLLRTRYPFRRIAYEAVAALDRAAFERRLAGLSVVEQTGRRVLPIAPHLVGLTGAVPDGWLARFRNAPESAEADNGEWAADVLAELARARAVRRSDLERVQRTILSESGSPGRVGAFTVAELEEALLVKPHAGDRDVGRSGVELWYQRRLLGKKGIRRFVHVPGRDRPIPINDRPPENGRPVTLTLDPLLQAKAEALLAADRARRSGTKQSKGKAGGALVALDPRTGAIVALATDPSYDPAALGDAKEYGLLRGSDDEPLRNRALEAAVPGSIFKPFTALAGLEAGVIQPGTGIECKGKRADARRPRCAYSGHRHGALASTNRLADALCHSCNAYFAMVGELLVKRGRGAGFTALFRRLMLDQILIDGPQSPLFPGRAWPPGRPDYTLVHVGEARNMGIGQDPVMISPLQAAALYGLLARGGVWRRPFVVRESLNADEPEQRLVAAAHVRAIVAGLARVTQVGGTAWGHPEAQRVWRSLDRIGIRVAGKTGSATRGTKAKRKPKHAWFASFAPLRDPEIVVIVFLENRGVSGGFGAAPIAAAFLEHYFRDRLEAAKPKGDGR